MELDPIVLETMLIIIAGVGSGVSAFFIGIRSANNKMVSKLDQAEHDIGLIKRCLIVKAKLIDDQTKASHPEVAFELEEVVREMINGRNRSP